jgi:tRNA dimethylallyltransferase
MDPIPNNIQIPVIVGPTAVGKTEVAIAVAEKLSGEIISADSRQIFRGMDIGTAKPTPQQRLRIPHHFVDELPPTDRFSAGDFGIQARRAIGDIIANGRIPLVVGGSGLYVRALMDGFFEGKTWDPEVRKRLNNRADKEGLETLYQEVKSRDPEAAKNIMLSDRKRIIRALEIMELTGMPMTSVWRERKTYVPFRGIWCGITMEREELYRRINQRVLDMIDQGLLDEVERLLRNGVDPSANVMNSVGYSEAVRHLKGEITYNDMVELIQRNTRRFAKRQWTWFRRDHRIRWFNRPPEQDTERIAVQVLQHIRDTMRQSLN